MIFDPPRQCERWFRVDLASKTRLCSRGRAARREIARRADRLHHVHCSGPHAMPKVFISYRRSDSQMVAGRLREALALRYGHDAIFRDKDSIGAGEDWTQAIESGLAGGVVVLALIGPGWASAVDAQGRRRLDDPADWNRVELELALQRGARVIPLRVEDAPLPSAAELPPSLQPLARLQALRLRDDDWDADLGRLLLAIGTPAAQRRRRVLLALATAGLLAAGGAAFLRLRSRSAPVETVPAGTHATPPSAPGFRDDIVRRLSDEQAAAVQAIGSDRVRAVGMIDRNLREIESALASFPDDAALHVLAGYAAKNVYASSKGLLTDAQRRNYLQRARDGFQRALQIAPDDAGAVNGMGNVLFYEHRFDEAVAHHRQAIELAGGVYPAAEHDLLLVQRVQRGDQPFDP